MIGNRRLGVAVTLAHEAAFLPQANAHEPVIADDNALQPEQIIDVELSLARFADRAASAESGPAADARLHIRQCAKCCGNPTRSCADAI
jgi:hypothetical protein